MSHSVWIAALLSFVAVTAQAAGHSAAAAAPKLAAHAAFDAKGRLWIAGIDGERVVLRRSDDAGRTFDAPRVVNATPEPIDAGNEAGPKIAFGTRGEIYLTWTRPLARPYTGLVRFSRSLDDGATFAAPVTVHRDASEITHAFDALGVDADGRVFVAWIDKRDRVAADARDTPYAASAIYYAWSDDRGASFAPERKLADHACECCRLALARTPRGGVALLWRQVFDGGIRDHAWAELSPGAQAPVVHRASYENWAFEGCPHHGPSLAFARDGTAHAVWYSAAQGNKIFYGQLQNDAAPRALKQIAGAGASYADVAVDGRNVWVAWTQVGDAGRSLQVAASRDGGATFDAPRTLATSDATVTQPRLVVHEGKAHALWSKADGPEVRPIGSAP